MAKSELAKALDELQSGLRVVLKVHGFRARGRTFNRPKPDGLIDVVNLQMGAFDPPGTQPILPYRPNLYGRFTVNLGVYVPEAESLLTPLEHRMNAGPRDAPLEPWRPPEFVQEYRCHVRRRLGELASETGDRWWTIQSDPTLLADLQARLERDALPFFERFGSRDRILGELGRGQPTQESPPRILCALVHFARGERTEARALLQRQADETRVSHPGHSGYVREIAVGLGLGELDPGK